MKKTVFIILCLLIGLFASTSFAVEVTVFGPNQYLRTTGAPDLYNDTFSAVQGEGILIVKNGTVYGENRIIDSISSATILVNGEQIFGPNDFNQQIYLLEKTVNLAESNSISIELASGPGSYLTIEVTQNVNPPTVNLSADPGTILIGDSSILTWSSTNADSCVIEPGIGNVDLSGTVTVSPIETTTYTITATGLGGTVTTSDTVTVTYPLPTVSISADPATITIGESSILSWISTNADYCTIEPGVGIVSTNGSTIVSPAETTTYTITATGFGGTATAQSIVTVEAAVEPQPEGSFGEQYEDLIPPDATVESYDPRRFSLITGLVHEIDDTPISDVFISIHSHPEYGTVSSDIEGRFSIPVEGGSTMTVVYEKEGLIPVQRKVYVPWNDIAITETIQMIVEDPVSTDVTFDGNSETVITHQSTEVTDEFGSRSCSITFTGDNQAYEVDAQGNVIQELFTITARATEFTTPESMPAILPPTSGYTYCVELSVDGAQRVSFKNPVIAWVNNFLGFDVGEIVPVGYYDRDKGVWIPSDNGLVVKLLDTNSNGIVDGLDSDGDGQPDDLNEDGSYTDEVTGLGNAETYSPESTFWRFTVTHFSPWDGNWPFGPPPGAGPPNPQGESSGDGQGGSGGGFGGGFGGGSGDGSGGCSTPLNSYAEERSRIFHDDIPIPGTDMTLHYASNRVEGYKTVIDVPASGETVPDCLKKIVVRVDVAGRRLEQILAPIPLQKAKFVWDGLDHLGRPVYGFITAHVSIGFVYDAVYYSAGNFAQTFAQAGSNITGIRGRQEITSWKLSEINILSQKIMVKRGGVLAEGWTPSLHHSLSPMNLSTLLKGNGTIIRNNLNIITIAGTGTSGYSGDGGPATEAFLSRPNDVAVDASGNIYIADKDNYRIRKVDISGIITTVAGNGTSGYSGDGGPATEAQLASPTDVAVDASDNIYITDYYNHCIRKVDQNGIITTVAGNGTSGYSGDGGPATEAQLWYPSSTTVDASGSLYISDNANYRIRKVDQSGTITTVAGNGTYGYSGDGGPAIEARLTPVSVVIDASGNLYIADSTKKRIRKVDTSGIITTVAGNGTSGYSGDGGPATEAQFSRPVSVTVDASGNLYIADYYNQRIRKVDTSGIINTVAGNGTPGYSGDGGPATEAQLSLPASMAVGKSGDLYIADSKNYCIRKVESPTPIFAGYITEGDIVFGEGGGLGHIMFGSGRHKTTIDLDTGVTLFEFGYNEENNLLSITDRFENQTLIERDANGVPIAIISPDGLSTFLTIDANNHLTGITYPDGSYYTFEYTTDGLMTAKIEPEGNRFDHVFDSTGRLTDATNEEGGHWQYSRTAYANGDILTEMTTGEGNLKRYLDHTYSTGAFTSTITVPSGAQTLFSQSADGLTVNKSLPCGMELEFGYDTDPEYKFKYVKEMRESTPSALEKIMLREKTYQDTNLDEIPDLITETVTFNGKSTVFENNTLQSQKTITSPEGRPVTTFYDPTTLLNNSITVPGLFETSYGYDVSGRLTSINTGTRQTSFTYNSQGFLESITDPENYTTTYDYDAVGRMTVINRADGSSLGFTYDQNGNMTVLTNPSAIDHGFGYNKVNLNSSYQTPLSGSYSYVYDKDKKLVQKSLPSGNRINNIYDTTLLTQIQTPEGNIDFTYLCGTKVESITKGTESITYEYNGSLITSENLGGTLNQTLGYSYNNDFNLIGFTYAGDTVNYTYDNDGLLIGSGGFTIFRNVGNGLPESVTGGALNLSRTFNGYGEVDGQDFDIGGDSLISWNLIRDNTGRITSKTETIVGTTSNYAYTYDPMGRLLTVTRNGILIEEYDYNENGTRIYEMNALRGISSRNYSYDDEDHLLTAGTTTYQYDLDGFLTTKTEGANVTTYNYSSRGELLSVNPPDGRVIEYVHDPLGRRIAKNVDGVTVEKYLWQGLTRLLAVYDGTDNLIMRFEYADSRMPVSMTKDGSSYYLSYAQVGSLKVVADASGNVVKRINYDSFGNIINDTDPAFAIPFGFAGGLHDQDTDLVRFGYRDYDPDTGRWTAKDPILFAGGDTDLYGYCLNDPVNLIDPDGLRIPGWGKVLKWGLTKLAKKIGGKIGEIIGELANLFESEIAYPPEQQEMDKDTDRDGISDYWDKDDDNDGIPDEKDNDPKKPYYDDHKRPCN